MAKKKYAFFGGSFDPPHRGHVALVNFIFKKRIFDVIFIVPVPDAPHKEKSFFSYEKRLQFLHDIFSKKKYAQQVVVSDIESKLPSPQYSYITLRKLQQHYSGDWSIILGMDSFATLPKWKNWQELAENYQMYVVGRKHKKQDTEVSFAYPPVFFQNKRWNFSSSKIKKELEEFALLLKENSPKIKKKKKKIKKLLPKKIYKPVIELTTNLTKSESFLQRNTTI